MRGERRVFRAVRAGRATSRGLLASVVLAEALLSTAAPGIPRAQMPAPTDVARGRDEEELHRERAEWIERLHRAAPGTDWRAIEAENWRAHLARRNAARAAGGAIAGTPPDLPWIEIGSQNLAGRTHQATFHAATNALYLGSNLGGLWRGDLDPAVPDTRTNWQPLSDGIFGGAYQVVVLDGPPLTLLKTHVQAFSSQVHRSTDGGATWTMATGVSGRVRRLLRLPDAGETVFAIADTPNQWLCDGTISSRLLRSQDRGATFQLVRDLGGSRGDIWTSRTGLGPLYLLAGNRLEVSATLGASWTTVGTLPWTGPSRAVLTASEAGGPTFYTIIQQNDCSGGWTLFRSSNGGVSWSPLGPVTDFWGDMVSLSASSTSADLVLYGGLELWRSTNGGTSFTKANAWWEYYADPARKLHADIPSIDFAPLPTGSEILFVATDGGTYSSTDGGATFGNLSQEGLRVSQYYSTLSDAADPRQIQAGSQDQGYQKGEAGLGARFDQLISGDYGHLTSSNGTHDLVYSAYPGFLLVAERSGTGTTLYGGSGNFTFPDEPRHWLPKLVADPLDPSAVYLCARHLYRYARSGNVWTPTQLPFDFANGTGDYASALGISPTQPSRWYVATDQGRLWRSSDSGGSWSLSTFAPLPAPQYLTGIAVLVDRADALKVYVGGSGYSNAPVYRSTDGGQSFAPFAAGLPSTLVYALAADALGGGDVYAATENGPYRLDSALGSWQSVLGAAAPLTTYWSVEPAFDRIRFGTHGRGIWDYAPPQPGCAFSVSPATASFGASGGSGVLAVSAGAGCRWSVSRLDDWVGLTAATKGTGSGVVAYSVAANPGAARTGHLTLQGQTLTVDQGASQAPTLSIDDASVDEGDAGTTPASFRVRLSSASAQTVAVSFLTANGSAVAPGDYTAVFGPVTFAPGVVTGTATVLVRGDTALEPDETFTVALLSPSGATVADGQATGTIRDDDGPALTGLELGHASLVWQDLSAASGLAGQDSFRLAQQPNASYEVVLDAASGDAIAAVLERLAADHSAVLQAAPPMGTGTALSLRWQNTGAVTVINQPIRVRSAGCTTACDAGDAYRIRAWDTTYTVPRFNNSGTQVTVLVVQNVASHTVSGRAHFWTAAGGPAGSQAFTLAARAGLVLNTATVPGLSGQGGSITVSHDGGYGALTGKAVALEPATGFSFDSPMAPRPR